MCVDTHLHPSNQPSVRASLQLYNIFYRGGLGETIKPNN